MFNVIHNHVKFNVNRTMLCIMFEWITDVRKNRGCATLACTQNRALRKQSNKSCHVFFYRAVNEIENKPPGVGLPPSGLDEWARV